MTTRVLVTCPDLNHQPVAVYKMNVDEEGNETFAVDPPVVLEKGESAEFRVWSNQGLRIRELEA